MSQRILLWRQGMTMRRYLVLGTLIGAACSCALARDSTPPTPEVVLDEDVWTIDTVFQHADEVGGFALADDGTVYVTLKSDHTIGMVRNGEVVTIAGSSGQGGYLDGSPDEALFRRPMGIAVGLDGALLIADTANGAVRRVTANGEVSTVARFAQASPVDLAVSGDGTVYVVDGALSVIWQVPPSSTEMILFAGSPDRTGYADGEAELAMFNHPSGLALDADGKLYVADTWNDAIRVVTPDGSVETFAGTPRSKIEGNVTDRDEFYRDGDLTEAWFDILDDVAIAPNGDIFVVERTPDTSAVRRISAEGRVTTIIFEQSPQMVSRWATLQGWLPRGIMALEDGRLLVWDNGRGELNTIMREG